MKISRQRASQLRKVARGMCALCSRPRINATHCEEHRQAFNAQRIAKMQARRAGGLCALCGRPSKTYECERHKVDRPESVLTSSQ